MGSARNSKAAREVLPETPPADPRARIPKATPAEAILPVLWAPMIDGIGGFRVTWIGNSGKGKSFADAWFVEQTRRRGFADVTLIVDDKDRRTAFSGAQRVNLEDADARPPRDDEDQTAVVFRGAALDPRRSVDVEDVCARAWQLVQQDGAKPTVLVAISELRRAVSPAGREWRGTWVPKTITEGRSPLISFSAETQSPQRMPVELFDNSCICAFGLGRRARSYLLRNDMIDPEVARILAELPSRHFIHLDDAGDWDGKVYEIPFRRAKHAHSDEE